MWKCSGCQLMTIPWNPYKGTSTIYCQYSLQYCVVFEQSCTNNVVLIQQVSHFQWHTNPFLYHNVLYPFYTYVLFAVYIRKSIFTALRPSLTLNRQRAHFLHVPSSSGTALMIRCMDVAWLSRVAPQPFSGCSNEVSGSSESVDELNLRSMFTLLWPNSTLNTQLMEPDLC